MTPLYTHLFINKFVLQSNSSIICSYMSTGLQRTKADHWGYSPEEANGVIKGKYSSKINIF